jgi:hypothetical protein
MNNTSDITIKMYILKTKKEKTNNCFDLIRATRVLTGQANVRLMPSALKRRGVL